MICVDIARDVMQMLDRDQPIAEIREAMDREYSQYGPPTDTDSVG